MSGRHSVSETSGRHYFSLIPLELSMAYTFRILASLAFFAGSALAQGTGSSQPNGAGGQPSVEARVKGLHALLNEQWEYTLRTSPEFASILGDKRYNDKLSDFSQVAIDRDIAQNRVFLSKFAAVDATGFPEQEKLNRDLMVRNLRETLDAAKFRDWEMPVNQMSGIHIDAPQLVTSLSFETVKDYDDYIARLKQLPRVFREVTVQMRKGMGEGLMPPKILLVQAAKQANDLATQKPEDSPFAIPTTKFPKEFAAADQQRLRDGVLAALRDSVLPAYVRFTAFVRDEYAPHGRTEIGSVGPPGRRGALCLRCSPLHDDEHDAGRDPRARPARSRAHRSRPARDRQEPWLFNGSSAPGFDSKNSLAAPEIEGADSRRVPALRGSDVGQAADAVRETAESQARGDADRAVS
jgi:hypothetical protein